MKYFVFATICALLIYIKASSGLNPVITFGAQGSREVLLTRDMVREESSFMRVVSYDYEFKQKHGNNMRTITRIVVTDQYTNGNGGKAKLTEGGPGHNYAKLHLKSKRGHGYNFSIDVFGQ